MLVDFFRDGPTFEGILKYWNMQTLFPVKNVAQGGPQAAYLLVWIAEMLNLCLCEFTDPEQALARGNLIAVGLSNLCSSKGQLATIVVQQIPALRKRTLSLLPAGV